MNMYQKEQVLISGTTSNRYSYIEWGYTIGSQRVRQGYMYTEKPENLSTELYRQLFLPEKHFEIITSWYSSADSVSYKEPAFTQITQTRDVAIAGISCGVGIGILLSSAILGFNPFLLTCGLGLLTLGGAVWIEKERPTVQQLIKEYEQKKKRG